MIVLKKLTFAPLFLIVFIILIIEFTPFLKSYDFIFSLSLNTLVNLITLSALISLSSLSFILFSALSSDLKYVLPVGILASLIPFLFTEQTGGIIFMLGIIVSLLITFLTLQNSLKTYLNFNVLNLFSPSIKRLSFFLIITISLVYFLSVSKIVSVKGFSLPDSILDTALKLTNQGSTQVQIPQISPDQLDLLKKNPQLLRQSGLDSSVLNNLSTSQNPEADLLKQTVKDQVQSFIKPYLGIIPAVLALLLFLTLQTLTSLTNLFSYPLLLIIFYILEKSGFVKFTTEMRPVKKLVI